MEQRRYCAWMLRCWGTEVPGAAPGAGWRFSLEDPHTGERRGFAGLDALVAFLKTELSHSRDEPLDGGAAATARRDVDRA